MSNSEKYCLKWNDFENNIRNSFRALREEQDLFDVTLATGDGYQIEAHKIILSAGSQFLSEILKRTKHPNPFIYLKGINRFDLEHVVDFLYNGEAYVAQDQLNRFLETAQELRVKGLQSNQEDQSIETRGNHYTDSKSPKNQNEDNNTAHILENVESIIDSLKVEDQEYTFGTKDLALNGSDEENLAMDTNNRLDLQIEQNIVKNEALWECKVCGKNSKRKADLKDHVETHIEGILHACSVCSRKCSTRNSLKVHIINNHSKQVFDCDICGKQGMNKMAFKSHKRSHKAELSCSE